MAATKDLVIQQGRTFTHGKTASSGICGIYLIENTIKAHLRAGRATGPVYVGQSFNVRNRFKAHRHMLRSRKHSSVRLQRAWDKYGEDAFSFRLLVACPREQLVEAEQFFIDEFDAIKNGYNVAPAAGSTLGVKITSEAHAKHLRDLNVMHVGRKRSAETCLNISEALKKVLSTPEARARMSEARRGVLHTDETKTINSKKSKEMWANPEIRARIMASRKNATYGPKTDEARKNILAAQQARRARERAEKEAINGL